MRGVERLLRIGPEVAAAWKRVNHDEDRFPELATAILADLFAGPVPTLAEITAWVMAQTELPHQLDPASLFGDPPLTVWRSRRFVVDVYTWLDGTTSIHEHAFRGAFGVLHGSSVHTRYRFSEEGRSGPRFRFGKLEIGHVEVLRRGDIRPIDGSRTIHSLFHLDRPSLSVIVRTYGDKDMGIQYEYLLPGLSVEPKPSTDVDKRVALLKCMHSIKDPAFLHLLPGMMTGLDPASLFWSLRGCFGFISPASFSPLLESATEGTAHGTLLRAVFDELQRQCNLVARRTAITEREHRMFVALLLNVRGRERILSLVAKEYPEVGPIKTVLRWLRELNELPSTEHDEPNAIGIKFDEGAIEVVRGLLEGKNPVEIVDGLRDTYHPDDVRDAEPTVHELCELLRTTPLFRSMFAYP